MGLQGTLGKNSFGYSLPVDAPLYDPFPLYYEDATILMFPYATAAANVAALLPSQLSVATLDPADTLAGAEVVFAHYGFSTVGEYNEVAQVVQATYTGSNTAFAGKTASYAVRLHVDNDSAMTAGREIGGFPKKMGHISFRHSQIYLSTLESPKGLLICSGEMAAVGKVLEMPAGASQTLPFFSLRVIPNPQSSTPPFQPSICQLIYTEWVLDSGTFWSGRGALHFTGASALNPYEKLPVLQAAPPLTLAMATATPPQPGQAVFRGRMTIGTVQVVETF